MSIYKYSFITFKFRTSELNLFNIDLALLQYQT